MCPSQAALHPTPAVCGRPRPAALAALSAAEPYDRGFYAGPFGWISGGAAEFSVAIRSALVHESQRLPSPQLLEQQGVLLSRESSEQPHSAGEAEVDGQRRASGSQASTSGSNGASNGAGSNGANGTHSMNGNGTHSILADAMALKDLQRQKATDRGGGTGSTHIISLYAGVGLVCGSDVDKEWQVRFQM